MKGTIWKSRILSGILCTKKSFEPQFSEAWEANLLALYIVGLHLPAHKFLQQTLWYSVLNPSGLVHQPTNCGSKHCWMNLPSRNRLEKCTNILDGKHVPSPSRHLPPFPIKEVLRCFAFSGYCSWTSEQEYYSQTVLQFLERWVHLAGSLVGNEVPKARGGASFGAINIRCWDHPNLWPLGKIHQLKTASHPQESSFEHLGILSGIYQAFPSWSKSYFNENRLLMNNWCQEFAFSSPSFLPSLSSSLLPWLSSLRQLMQK